MKKASKRKNKAQINRGAKTKKRQRKSESLKSSRRLGFEKARDEIIRKQEEEMQKILESREN